MCCKKIASGILIPRGSLKVSTVPDNFWQKKFNHRNFRNSLTRTILYESTLSCTSSGDDGEAANKQTNKQTKLKVEKKSDFRNSLTSTTLHEHIELHKRRGGGGEAANLRLALRVA